MSETTNTIHYVDLGNFYSVYGISTLIIVLLLIWYFIRSNLSADYNSNYCEPKALWERKNAEDKQKIKLPGGVKGVEGLEGFPIEDPDILAFMPEFSENSPYDYQPISITQDGQEKPYKFISGMYGDVPLNIYDTKDLAYKPEWDHRTAMYVPNMRTVFRQTYTPVESVLWE